MCTAVVFGEKNSYFGRNLDLERVYREQVVFTPRGFELCGRSRKPLSRHFAIMGMATVIDGYPLYYDGFNEHGLSIAGLNFVQSTQYSSRREEGKENVAQFDLIPLVLGTCRSVSEARELLSRINILDTPFRDDLPVARLHWMLSDQSECAVLEFVREGASIYDNPVGVLTNEPPFRTQLFNLGLYQALSPYAAESGFSDKLKLPFHSRGMGAFGLPGDVSSASRFVRAAFVRANAFEPRDSGIAVEQFFHILSSVEQVEGCVRLDEGLERTQYSSCCDLSRRVYHYKTYNNSRITSVAMPQDLLDRDRLLCHSLLLASDAAEGELV